ncbi:Non-reducing polyketide synthase azaA [Hypsizygus marmoreus]|uniref:Non-reducing polyketide synthase azaA n=1 Tax=Hypsizygus marmoreus TaxID=39966 RepID=A0A369K232_HYPMA|nr:Non-reducing polyketide synthase azaA [Hypsizygus marmoreus]
MTTRQPANAPELPSAKSSPAARDSAPTNLTRFRSRSYMPEMPSVTLGTPQCDGTEAAAVQIDIKQRTDLMDDYIEKYSSGLSKVPSRPSAKTPEDTVTVLLTGSTGHLGTDILAILLADVKVHKVYTLNRRSSEGPTSERHHAKFKSKQLDTELLNSRKFVSLDGDTSLASLGLDTSSYEEIRGSVTVIIHNAWPIKLSRSLSFFEPNLRGLRNLIDMALASPRAPNIRFLFSSTYFAAQSWNSNDGPVPEDTLTDPRVGVGLGYGESKYVAEQILSRSGLESSSLRLCQLCGRSTDGGWSPFEWVPIMVKASFEMGAFPIIAGFIPWIPLDIAAKCTVDIVLSDSLLPPALNISHPRPSKWDILEKAVPVPKVTFSQWVSMLESRAAQASPDELQRSPAFKLLSGFQKLAVDNNAVIAAGRQDIDQYPGPLLSTEKAQAVSQTLRELQRLSPREGRRWVEYWMTAGFIDPGLDIQSRL